MGHGHGHGAAGAVSAGGRHRRALAIAFGVTLVFMVVELGVGFGVDSLALISDGAHMGTDVLGLGMTLAAITLAARPAAAQGDQRTFGGYRLEVLAALANGVLLFAVAGYVLYEAYQRIFEPATVPGLPMLVVAVAGLLVNVFCLRLLSSGAKESLNLQGARLEVLGDLLGSIGVLIAGLVVATTGWGYADPIVGAAIGLFILPRTWRLSAQALRILMEVAPPGLDVGDVRSDILSVSGVSDVHDLHVWTVTSGLESATGHVVVADEAAMVPVLCEVQTLLAEKYSITHTTIQCEPEGHAEADPQI